MRLAPIITRIVDPAKPVVETLIPDAVVDRLLRPAYYALRDARILGEPDRRFMRERIVPALARAGVQRLLFVGVRSYTRSILADIEGAGIEVWSSDIDPEAHVHGRKGRHVTVDIRVITPKLLPFRPDAVLMNGVLGYGVNTEEDCAQALTSVKALVSGTGNLVLGWNTDRCPDVPTIAARTGWLAAALPGLDEQVTFQGSTHVYTFLKVRK